MRKRIALIVAALLALGIGAGIAYASIPGPDGVIHGCYKNSNPAQGALIAIDSAASCPSGYTALNWNQTGPQGAPGLAGYQYVFRQVVGPWPVNNPPQVDVSVDCPVGKQVVWSGGDSNPRKGIVTLDVGFNQTGEIFQARTVFDNRDGDTLQSVTALAICANVN